MAGQPLVGVVDLSCSQKLLTPCDPRFPNVEFDSGFQRKPGNDSIEQVRRRPAENRVIPVLPGSEESVGCAKTILVSASQRRG